MTGTILANSITRDYMSSCDFAPLLRTQLLKNPQKVSVFLCNSENSKAFHFSVPHVSFSVPHPEISFPLSRSGEGIKTEPIAGERHAWMDPSASHDPWLIWVVICHQMQFASQEEVMLADSCAEHRSLELNICGTSLPAFRSLLR